MIHNNLKNSTWRHQEKNCSSLMAFQPFFMAQEDAFLPYQQAFFVAVNEFAQLAAKGLGGVKAWDIAINEGCSVVGIPFEHRGFQDLILAFVTNKEIKTEFLKNGEKFSAVVRWNCNDLAPHCI